MEHIVLNRETEKLIFHPPAYINFHLKAHAERGFVHFSTEAVRQMNLKPGDLIEFTLEGKDWLLSKTDNKNGYNLFTVGRKDSKALGLNSNKLVRGFLSRNNITDRLWVKCLIEREELNGIVGYPRFKITIINNK